VSEAKDLVPEDLLSVEDACKFLSVSRMTLYRQMDSGKLRYTRIGRLRRIPKQAVAELIERGMVPKAT
jgi:excisionase family DNA binding protein